jgi:lipopolysaccharide biosynthesis glycosyltransferase
MQVTFNPSPMAPFIDVCLCCDRHAVDGFIGVVASAATHLGKGWTMRVHLLDCGLGDELRLRVEQTVRAQLPNVCLEIAHLDPSRLNVFPDPSGLNHASKATYAKMLLHEMFPHLDRVIYLDCDLLVQRDLTDLASVDLESHCLAAVQDNTVGTLGSPVETLAQQFPTLALDAPYLNAGVLVLDLERLRVTGATEMFRSMAAVVAAKFGDQSLWNAAYPGLWRKLPEHWNRQVFLLPKFNLFPSGPASIWHFTRDFKPWHFEPGSAFGLVASWNHSLASVDWDMSATPRCRVKESRLKALLKWAVSRIENLF